MLRFYFRRNVLLGKTSLWHPHPKIVAWLFGGLLKKIIIIKSRLKIKYRLALLTPPLCLVTRGVIPYFCTFGVSYGFSIRYHYFYTVYMTITYLLRREKFLSQPSIELVILESRDLRLNHSAMGT